MEGRFYKKEGKETEKAEKDCKWNKSVFMIKLNSFPLTEKHTAMPFEYLKES